MAENIRLITVSDENISSSPLLADVLLSLNLKKENCLCLNYDQIQHMECKQPIRYWLLSENSDQIDRTLPFCKQAEQVYRSPSWQQFQSNHQAKRALWQQIQQP